MNLHHQLVPGCPITLRYGEERDRDFLAGIFTEVWATIPDEDKAAILSRALDRGIAVDVLPPQAMRGFDGLSDMGGDIRRKSPLCGLLLARLSGSHRSPRTGAQAGRCIPPHHYCATSRAPPKRRCRVATILKRWGYPALPKPKNPFGGATKKHPGRRRGANCGPISDAARMEARP